MRITSVLSAMAVVALAAGMMTASPAVAQEKAPAFQVLGLGGAGGMYTPTISPNDPKLMFITCDMSGVYRSEDGGKTWALLHYKQISSVLHCRPAFTKDAIYWADEGRRLVVSKDAGKTWTSVLKDDSAAPWKGSINHIAIAQTPFGQGEKVKLLVVGTDAGTWYSQDAGADWQQAGKAACKGIATFEERPYFFIAEGKKVTRIGLGKKSWEELSAEPAKGKDITSLTGVTVQAGEGKSSGYMFVTADGAGILRGDESCEKWEVCAKWNGQNDILVPAGQDKVIYASQSGGGSRDVFKSADGGKTWESIFRMDGDKGNVERSWVQTVLGWGYYISPLGLGIDPAHPDTVMVTTQGDFYRSTDGGKKWLQMMNIPVGKKDGDDGFRWKSSGLEVTSCWAYRFDPNDDNRTYICYTDIGFGRSVDRGETWIWAAKGCPWGNTFYEIAFDPSVKGKIYAACSSRHDIPHWTHIDANKKGQEGGVCVSTDYGANWKVLGKGLPALPCTGILIDPKSAKADKLTMYVTMYEGGVFKSVDGGATWEKKSKGLGNEGNLHAYKIRAAGDNLYCLITAQRDGSKFPINGGIWKSTDGGESWTDITASAKLAWPTDFVIDAKDENTIFMTAATIPGGPQGGIYKTTDGGKNWSHVAKDADFGKWTDPGYVQAMMVKFDPADPKNMYAGTAGHGLWFSTDAGETWKPCEAFPFRCVQNVAFDPKDPTMLYVTTFGGGVWKGLTPTGEKKGQ